MIKRLPLTSALLVSTALMAGAASAADIVEPAPIFNWSGFYLGVHAGAVFGQDHNNGCGAFTDLVEQGGIPTDEDAECSEGTIIDPDSPHEGLTFPFFEFPGAGNDTIAVISNGGDDNGADFIAGGQIGIDQQYGNWVIGLVADASGVFGSDDRNVEFEYFGTNDLNEFQGSGFISGGDLDWTATFRARLGPVLGDEGRLLIYGTGGLALAGINGLKGTFEQFEDGCFPCDFGHSNDTIRVGFAAGGGFEWALTDNVSLGAEYLFLGFGDWDEGPSLTFYGRDGRQFTFEDDFDHLHVARVTLNLRFPNP